MIEKMKAMEKIFLISEKRLNILMEIINMQKSI